MLPKHVAIIMDGNGRWSTERGSLRVRGHREGAKRVDEIVTASRELGISYLTLYAFSTENWNRPGTEVNMLMRLLVQHLKTMDKKLIRNQVALRAQGQIDRLPPFVIRELKRVLKSTSSYEPRLTLTLCLSYGGRQEIVESARSIASKVKSGELELSDINESLFREHLYQPDIPDPDLLIRTGGEYRISNFLLWEIAYTELYVTEVRWPEFDAEELNRALSSYVSRERRFGKTSGQLKTDADSDWMPNL